MPLQNRVTPFGEIMAAPQRGSFTGNRGIVQDPTTKTLLGRHWTTKAWITCRHDYKDIRRAVMATRSWTELFFLDAATALAAGHRPCFLCRRDAAKAFQMAWAAGNGGMVPTALQMDTVLHRERLQHRKKRIHALGHAIDELPDGAMVARGDQAFVIAKGRPLLWTPGGYLTICEPFHADGMLTPPATLAALQSGYRATLHPSAMAAYP